MKPKSGSERKTTKNSTVEKSHLISMAANFEEQRHELLMAQERCAKFEEEAAIAQAEAAQAQAEVQMLKNQLELLNQAVRELQGRSRGPEKTVELTQVSVSTNNRYECLELEEVNMSEQERPLKRIRHEKENIFLKPIKGDDKEAKPAALAKKAREKEKNKAVKKDNEKGKVEETMTRTSNGIIKVKDLNAKVVVKKLNEEGLQYKLRGSGMKEETTIICQAADKAKIMNILAENDQRGHAFLTKEEKFSIKVLKGMNYSYDAIDIYEDLVNKGIPSGHFRVDRFVTGSAMRNKITLPHFVVKAENDEIMEKIIELPAICYMRPRWEEMKRKGITRCFNCFEAGHSKRGGCLNKWRCKKCGSTEEEHQCQIVKRAPGVDEKGNKINEYEDFYCYKCNKKGHSPAWPRCPVNMREEEEIMRKIETKKEKERQRVTQKYIPAPTPIMNPWEPKPISRANKVNIRAEIERLMGKTYEQLEEEAENFIARYEKLRTDEEKRRELMLFFLEMKGWQA